MCSFLAGYDYTLSTANDGLTALAMIENNPPDLILLDVMMPGPDGYEVTRRLKANSDTKGIPVILVTALGSPDDRAKGLEAGAEDFLTKPVNPEEIEARIQSMLKLKRYQDQLAIRSHSENHIFSSDPFADLPEESEDQPRILIVDDDIKDIKMLHYHLDTTDYHLSVVNNGSDAIEAISCQRFDLILLDILMPGMDGFEICRRIKHSEAARHTQVVLITCLSDIENKIDMARLFRTKNHATFRFSFSKPNGV